MLFNLDKDIKNSILQEYKREALLHQQKREQEKQQKLKEEREFMEQKNRRNEISSQILKEEENLRKSRQLKYYQEMMKTPKKNTVGSEIDIQDFKNYGQGRNQSISYKNSNPYKYNYNRKNNNIYTLNYSSLTPMQKDKMFVRKNDNMNQYLTDEINQDEVLDYLRGERQYRQKYYNEILNNQLNQAQKKIKDEYGTNDILIIENRRKNYLYEKPFKFDKRYDFGKSNLIHNPITNPTNDIGYNKYINLRLNRSNIIQNSIQKNYNLNNINDLNNNNNLDNSNSLGIKTDDNSYNQQMKYNNDYTNYYMDINKKSLGNKYCQSEADILSNKGNNINDNVINNNDTAVNKNYRKKLELNNYACFSNDNIFDYKKNINKNTDDNSYIKKYETENNNNNNNMSIKEQNGSILSQAAKSNFLI